MRILHVRKSPIVCPSCFAQRCAQRVTYDLRCDWYVCLIHGPVITAEWLFSEMDAVRP